MKKLNYLLTVLLLSICFSSSWATKVLVLSSDRNSSWYNDVHTKIQNTGLFEVVDFHSACDSIASYEKLMNYDAVFFYNVNSAYQQTILADNITNYINNGGGFVDAICHTGNYSPLWSIEVDDYRVFQEARYSSSYGAITAITKDIPTHPILENVETFAAQATYQVKNSDITLLSNAYTVVTGNNGNPLVCARENVGQSNARRVALNFLPISSDVFSNQYSPTTDGALLMANALLWVAGGSIAGDKNNVIGQADTIIYTPVEDETFLKWYKKQNEGSWVEYNTTDTFLIETYDTVSQWHYMVEMLNDTVLDSTAIFTVQSKYAQTLTFDPLLEMAMTDADQALVTSTNSDSAVTFTSSNEAIATIVNGKVHPVSTGTVTISAIAEENNWYWASETLTQDVTIKSQAQTLTFTLVDTVYVGDADIAPGATATSTLAVSYSSSDSCIATIVDNKVKFVSAGTCTIYADQAGNGTYAAAPQVSQELVVLVHKPSITYIYPTEEAVIIKDSVYTASATITTEDAGGIDSAIFVFGTSADALTDTMSLDAELDTFSTDFSIDLAGTYFTKIVAYGVNGEITSSDTFEINCISLAPVILKAYPSQDTVYYVGDSITLGVRATVPAGTINSVYIEFSSDAISPMYGFELENTTDNLYCYKDITSDPEALYIKFYVVGNGDTATTDYVLFDTQCGELDAVTALAADEIRNTTFKAHWTAYSSAEMVSKSANIDAMVRPQDEYLINVFQVLDGDTSYVLEAYSTSDTFLVVSDLNENTSYQYHVKYKTSAGCMTPYSNSINVTTAVTTQLNETENLPTVRTEASLLIVSTKVATEVTIYHISGQKVKTYNINSEQEISLNSGIYIVRLNNNVHKVIVP